MKKLLTLALAFALTLSMVACSAETTTSSEESSTSSQESSQSEVSSEESAIPEFSVTVVTDDGEFEITNETIADLEIVEQEIVKSSQSGDSTSTWTGVSLVEALSAVGVENFSLLSIEATDGYAVEYTAEITETALLTYLENGEELGEDGPVSTVVDGQLANTWMKNLSKIVVVSDSSDASDVLAIPEFSITIVSGDESFEVTNETIADMEIIEQEILKTSQKGDSTSTWTGVSLMEVLSSLGIEEFETLAVEASDGYSADYTYEMAESTLITFYENGEELGEDGPVNTVIDGESGSSWMKNLTVITVG